MKCQRCGKEKVMGVLAKCGDMCSLKLPDGTKQDIGYVPYDIGLGGGDYFDFEMCMHCGQVQGSFPVYHVDSE